MKKNSFMKKNNKQTVAYASEVRNRLGYDNTADEGCFENLQGSSDGLIDNKNNTKPAGGKRRSAKKFFKKHLFDIIVGGICTVVISVMGWICSNLIYLRESVAVYDYRLNQMQTSLENGQNTTINKEYLSQEIKLLKAELQTATTRDLAGLELRIALLEEQIKEK